MVLNEYLRSYSNADHYSGDLVLDFVLRKETISWESPAVREWDMSLEAAGKDVCMPRTKEQDKKCGNKLRSTD
ncbi:MAG TPA: hypothetical protein VKF36_09205, partial [Syntrophorhabdales bacterium]|nr:hypothetical protein [Syntrophorhabdales bacterium]